MVNAIGTNLFELFKRHCIWLHFLIPPLQMCATPTRNYRSYMTDAEIGCVSMHGLISHTTFITGFFIIVKGLSHDTIIGYDSYSGVWK